MYKFPIGVMLDSFRCNTKDAVKKAAKVGAEGVQMYAAKGEYSPEYMTAEKRRELLDMIKSEGLCVSALCGDLGMGFGNPELNPDLIEKSKRIMDLAINLETNIVTTHIGVIPEDKKHPRYSIIQNACYELSCYAKSVNACFAIETGPEKATVLRGFLDELGSVGIAVNYDPANFVMVTKDDPVEGVYTLADYIVHTHAKDGINIRTCDPEAIYEVIDEEAHNGIDYAELPLGEGDVDFSNYLKALKDVGYMGFLTIEREVGQNPIQDIEKAVSFLKNKISTL